MFQNLVIIETSFEYELSSTKEASEVRPSHYSQRIRMHSQLGGAGIFEKISHFLAIGILLSFGAKILLKVSVESFLLQPRMQM